MSKCSNATIILTLDLNWYCLPDQCFSLSIDAFLLIPFSFHMLQFIKLLLSFLPKLQQLTVFYLKREISLKREQRKGLHKLRVTGEWYFLFCWQYVILRTDKLTHSLPFFSMTDGTNFRRHFLLLLLHIYCLLSLDFFEVKSFKLRK